MTFIPTPVAEVLSNNSTSTPLLGSAVFTGAADDVTQAATITVYALSDVKSAKNGLEVQFSADGATWTSQETHTVKADIALTIEITMVAQFFRINFTNGAAAQATFLLQSISHPSRNNPITVPLSATTDVALGAVPGAEYLMWCGRDAALGTTLKTLWTEPGVYAFPTAASTMTVSSTDANDAVLGTGALVVQLTYLNANFAQGTETIVMDGQSAVTTSASIIRINNIMVVSSGSGGSNAGTIYVGTGAVVAGVPANVFGVIAAGDANNQTAVYTVPANKSVKFMFAQASVQSLGELVELGFNIRFAGTNTWQRITSLSIKDGVWTSDFTASPPLPERTDVTISARTLAPAASTNTSACLMVLLADEK